MYWKDSKNIFEENNENVHSLKGQVWLLLKWLDSKQIKLSKLYVWLFFNKNIHSHNLFIYLCLSIACKKMILNVHWNQKNVGVMEILIS